MIVYYWYNTYIQHVGKQVKEQERKKGKVVTTGKVVVYTNSFVCMYRL